jgi:hypothetical protein
MTYDWVILTAGAILIAIGMSTYTKYKLPQVYDRPVISINGE